MREKKTNTSFQLDNFQENSRRKMKEGASFSGIGKTHFPSSVSTADRASIYCSSSNSFCWLILDLYANACAVSFV